ncbi:MAG: hypothetical protein PGN15_12110 [Aeromicrobium erythreum]
MSPLDRSLSSTAALTAAWRFVDGGFGYSAPQLFVLVLDRRARIVGPVIHLYDEHQAAAPDDGMLGLLVERLAETVEELAPGGGVALMKARPGRSPVMTAADLRWCRALHRHLQAAPFSSRPLFFATDAGARVVAPDELIG